MRILSVVRILAPRSKKLLIASRKIREQERARGVGKFVMWYPDSARDDFVGASLHSVCSA